MKLTIPFVFLIISTGLHLCAGDVPAPPDPIRDFAVADSENIWIVTRDSEVLHLSGSKTERITHKARQIFFLNSSEGWLLGENGQVWSTNDGGETWMPRGTIGIDPTGTYGGQIVFASASDGWIVGPETVWLTEDGGETWIRVYPSDDLNPVLQGCLATRYFPIDADSGWLAMDHGHLLRTNDKGRTWEVTSIGDNSVIRALFPFSTDDAIAFGFEKSRIVRWNSAEGSWVSMESDSVTANVGVFSTSFPSRDFGWAAGIEFTYDSGRRTRGAVLKTIDGGKSWQRQEGPMFNAPFKRVSFWNSSNGWLVGKSEVFETNDGGASWRLVLDVNKR